MALKTYCFLLLLCSVALVKSETRKLDPDVGLDIKELVPKYDYPFEEHVVVTEDGYVLELHRIPHGRKKPKNDTRPVALVLHGMLCSSDSWVNMGVKNSLGFILADEGYDVWLGNHRGTTWSRKHISLDLKKEKKQFWEFSYHEMGLYDNTAIIDYVLTATQSDKLFYIGHSQGTTSFFAMTALRPEYNNKVRLMVGLAPVTYTEKLKTPLVPLLLPFKDTIWKLIEKFELYGLLQHNNLITAIAQIACNKHAPTQDLCVIFMSLIAGFNIKQTNKNKIPLIGSSVPAGASYMQFSHYFQGYLTGEFKQYDYGVANNVEKYNQPTPPSYNLSAITAPVAIFFGKNDYLATEENVYRTVRALPNVVYNKSVKKFNHMDFLWAIDVTSLLYKDVLKLMKKY